MRSMAAQSPAKDKQERKKRRQAGAKELNRVAKDLDPEAESLGWNVGGAEAAAFHRQLLANPKLGAAG